MRWSIWVWDELSCNFITKIAGFAFIFGLQKLAQSSPFRVVHRLEKSTLTPLVALQTNMSYVANIANAGWIGKEI